MSTITVTLEIDGEELWVATSPPTETEEALEVEADIRVFLDHYLPPSLRVDGETLTTA